MGSYQIDNPGMVTILKQVASDLKTHIEELQELDAKIGDGDLGVTIELICDALAEYLSSTTEHDVGAMLVRCGVTINQANPSTFGTILASAFMGGGKAVTGKTTIEFKDLLLIGERAIENIKKRGKSEVGGKTLLDTIVPAVNKLKQELDGGTDEIAAIAAAIEAAREGMKSTINMKAKYGRAACFQNDSIGIQDAGATTLYYIIESFARHLSTM